MSNFDWNKELPVGDNKYAKLPPIGGTEVYDIKEIIKVTKEDDSKGKFWVRKMVEVETKDGRKIKIEESQDWRLDLHLIDGKILSLTSLPPIISLKQAGVNNGMKVQIARPEKGVYMINILGESKKTIAHEEDPEDEKPIESDEDSPF